MYLYSYKICYTNQFCTCWSSGKNCFLTNVEFVPCVIVNISEACFKYIFASATLF